MHKTILHIGSNCGDRANNLASALNEIGQRIGHISKASSIYETEPWGLLEQDTFLNQGLEVHTIKNAFEILEECMLIEKKLGRERIIQWGPRIIDIDIIFYDHEKIESELLIIPHPRMHERNFVLIPLSEIIPDWNHPVLKKSIAQLKENSIDTLSTVIKS